MFRQLCGRALSAQSLVASKRPAALMVSARVPQGLSCRLIHGSVPTRKENEKPLPPSLIEKYQLNEPSRWVPLTVGSFVLASATGLYHWDAESQLLGLFVLYVGTIYTQAGSSIRKFFDDTADAILKEHRAIEDAQIDAVRVTLEAHKRQTGIYGDIKQVFESQKTLVNDIVATAGNRLKQEVRGNFVKKLDSIVQMEAETASMLQHELVNNATSSVRAAFTSGDEKLTGDALNSALDALADPSAQKDQVGELYTKYFQSFRKSLSEATGKEHKLSPELLAEVAELMNTVAKREGIETEAAPKKVVLEGF